jgi:hypothetical protein
VRISPVHYLKDHTSRTIRELVSQASEDILIIGDPRLKPAVSPWALERLANVIQQSDAGLAFCDSDNAARVAYQKGSVRDDFDLGPLVALSVSHSKAVLDQAGSAPPELLWGGLYDLRLRLAESHPIVHVPEPLCESEDTDQRSSGERQFDYVNPGLRDYQLEMEEIATRHLKRIGAYLEPRTRRVAESVAPFPATASVVIPVRNRESTVGEAIRSALSQETDFEFNVIVVDNHSTDGTGEVIDSIDDSRVVRIVPEEQHLGIGGCWNVALFSDSCGRIAVQLDSDDLYSDERVLRRLVTEMQDNRFAMLVGAYTTVDFELGQILPGLVDHREWTGTNGHNNVLRINGMGAPRVFDVSVLRTIGFPNVSYGEDYAVGLRISREYEVGRVFDSVYLCRRWEGNTDSSLPPEVTNRFNTYKDWLRTQEIEARIAMNARGDTVGLDS